MTTITGTVSTVIPPARAPGERVILSWMPDDEIPAAHRGDVMTHVARLSARHGLGPVAVRYFGPARPGRLHELDGRIVSRGDFYITAKHAREVPLGTTPDPATIGLHVGLRGQMLAHTIAHEIRHLIQGRDGLDGDERDADAFAAGYVLETL